MKFDVVFLVTAAALAVMLYCLWLLLTLRKDIPGGAIGRQWRVLEVLVWLFALGYLATPFASLLSEPMLRLIVAVVFLFGAAYVVITVKLIHRIIREMSRK
jgi:hypothetical protein